MGRLRLIFLQACESEASIRHAAIAWGALDRISQPSQYNEPLRSGKSTGATSKHHYHALKEYAMVIHYAQADVKKDLRTVLMISLAIISFEAWYGNHDIALQQIKIGVNLLREWNKHPREINATGYSTPAPYDVENVLLPVFDRLSVQLNSSAADQLPDSPSKSLATLKINGQVYLESMPGKFSTLDEAEKFYHAAYKLHLGVISKGRRPTTRPGDSTRIYPLFHYSFYEKEVMTRNIERWLAAFAPLKKVLWLKEPDKKKVAITFELQMKTAYIYAITAWAENESIYDDHYDFFKDIVHLSEALLNISNSAAATSARKFCFDMVVVLPLWCMGHKCRDRALRRKAVSLLLNFPRREGIWDSLYAAKIIECLMEFEEKHMEAGYIPEWARIWCAMITVNEQRNGVEIVCE
jgi:hypothetical protein